MPPTFALVSPCGFGNLGDAAIQDAMIVNIQQRFPRARIVGITLKPSDTSERHGVESFRMSAQGWPGYGQVWYDDRFYEANSDASGQPSQTPAQGGLTKTISSLGSLCTRTVKLMLPEKIRSLLRRAYAECRHVVKSWQLLRNVDTLIFSGGGQLDDFWGGCWGHPFAMMKWALLAKLANARVLFLSVGYGSLDSRLARVFTRLALTCADYRSYRDAGSRTLMRQAGFGKSDPVYPDIAYSRPEIHQRRTRFKSVRAVGISPIAYCDSRVWPRSDPNAFEAYLKRMTQVAVWLLQMQRRLVCFASDGPDHRVANELIARVLSQVAHSQRADIVFAPVSSVDEFLEQAAAVDVLVASRLHGLLLSHLAGTPTIAISYDRKVDVLVRDMQQEPYSMNIDAFNLSDFQRTFAALEGAWSTVHDRLRVKREEYRVLLNRQYDSVLGQAKIEFTYMPSRRNHRVGRAPAICQRSYAGPQHRPVSGEGY
jgi:polysaccharide pyruvyl transferase WcaK-like protein